MGFVPTRLFTMDFKIEAVKMITAMGLAYAEAGRRLDISPESINPFESLSLREKAHLIAIPTTSGTKG